jgi:predicted ATPase
MVAPAMRRVAWLRPVRLACTAAAACGYGTGVGVSTAATATGDVHGFPAVLTSFVGRDEPVREVARLLERQRLVTVAGPGGAGKTRLAGEVAWAVAGQFADGAWLAELGSVQDPALVVAVVAAVLGVPEQPGVPLERVLVRALSRRQLLLVLDNCEHLIGAAAELCAGLLAACDDVRVLATSREPLRIAGEARYRLGPLSLPDGDDLAGLGGSEAVALFADRVRQ